MTIYVVMFLLCISSIWFGMAFRDHQYKQRKKIRKEPWRVTGVTRYIMGTYWYYVMCIRSSEEMLVGRIKTTDLDFTAKMKELHEEADERITDLNALMEGIL